MSRQLADLSVEAVSAGAACTGASAHARDKRRLVVLVLETCPPNRAVLAPRPPNSQKGFNRRVARTRCLLPEDVPGMRFRGQGLVFRAFTKLARVRRRCATWARSRCARRRQACASKSSGQNSGFGQIGLRLSQVRDVDVFPLREEVPATRLMSSALWLRGRLVVPRFAPAEQLAGIFQEHAQARQSLWHLASCSKSWAQKYPTTVT